MALSVIGAGAGRTGTLTLRTALEALGLGPCYHMRTILMDPDRNVPAWDRVARGEPADWDAIFEGYCAAVDFPTSAFAVEIAAHYPEARVILTERDPERWYKSFSETIAGPMSQPLPDRLSAWGAMVRKAIVDRVFDGDILDRDHVIACYQRHNAAMRRAIPAERLLVFNVADGWEPLCAFLGVPVPEAPFPKVNSTEEWLAGREKRFGEAAPVP